MSDTTVIFDDAAAYERFMGRWSRTVGDFFLDWVAPPRNARWLDVGCGTGIFTELVLNRCSPATMVAVDPAAGQIDYARKRPVARLAEFRVADAQSLPFSDQTFDLVASALVLNFIPNRARAVAEMRRVSRPGGVVAAYVWDFATERGTAWPLARGMRQIGMEVPAVPGATYSSLDVLRLLFDQAGLEDIATRPIDITVTYSSFTDFWQSQVPPFTLNGKAIAALQEADHARLVQAVRAALPTDSQGQIAYPARANAIKARVPV
jgi:ubiquinone/menaquinone biosynthesis C-methylase UbiE